MRDISNSIGSILGNIQFTAIKTPVYSEEGVDHINISFNSTSELGRFLSTRSRTPFTHPVYGEFQSVEGLWQYLTRESDQETTETIRNFYGNRNTRHMSKLVKRNVDNFKDIIFEVMVNKIYTNTDIAKMLVENELPLLMYYIDVKGSKITVPFSGWFIRQIDDIKKQLVNDKPWENDQEQLDLSEQSNDDVVDIGSENERTVVDINEPV